ncbi:MAG TPA: TonB-dependent receptor, partial [Cytophagales bacterium]|nr:TonB-dependent receptor [Cytophagales bacterium]
MKIHTTFFVIFSFLAALAQAQKLKEISIHADRLPMAKFIEEVERKSGYQFFYFKKWTDSLEVTLHQENKPVNEILTEAFAHTRLQFYVQENKIILSYNTPIIEGLATDFFSESQKVSETNFKFEKEYVPDIQRAGEQVKKSIEIGQRQANPKSKATLTGYVKEKKSNEAITGAVIQIDKLTVGTTTNAAGFYSLSIPPGTYTIVVKYVGMVTEKKEIILYSDGKLDFSLAEDIISLKEVTVEADRDANISGIQMGKSTLEMKSIKNVPKVLGENDILRVVTMLPGVKTVGEGSAGLNVRGGNADQNLMLMNEATIYNTSHFLGFFSVFNSDAIKTSELYKSAIPAQYGGRLSSIFDVQLKDGNQKKFSGNGGISPVSARMVFEIPLIKDRTSLMLGGRTTYSDWILKQVPNSSLKNSSASFYDLVGRLSHKFNENNTLALSYYYSFDKFKLGSDSVFSYSNNLASLQWRTRINKNLFSQLSLTHSGYNYQIDYQAQSHGKVQKKSINDFDLGFGIDETNAKLEFNYYQGVHKIDFGLQSKLYNLNPGFINPKGDSSIVSRQQVQKERGLENALYVSDNIDISSKFSVGLGLRFSSFTALGPRSIYEYAAGQPKDNLSLIDSITAGNGKPIKTFYGPEYRLSARYSLSEKASVKISYNRTRQYIHMLSNTISVSPTTTWKLSDPNVLPQYADQLAAGYYKNLFNNTVEASVEAYYKEMHNVLDYKVGSELILNKHIEQDILQGQGRAYGIEFLLRKRSGKLNGWISYTYSRTYLQMNGAYQSEKVNGGNFYPANYDKPHDVSVVGNYKFTRRYSLSMNFVYNTGRPITYPIGQYQFGGGYKIDYSDRNQFRIPDYIRLDLGVNIEGNHKVKTVVHGFWSISIYNVL